MLFDLFSRAFTFKSWGWIALEILLPLEMRKIACDYNILSPCHQTFSASHSTVNCTAHKLKSTLSLLFVL